MKDDTESRSADLPISDAPEGSQEREDASAGTQVPAHAPEGTQERDGEERSSNQSHMRFDARGQAQFAGSSGMLFEQAMAQTRMAICLTDPNQHDNPIVFANRAFRELTGYDEDEIVGRNCRFLQGKRTDREQVRAMREAIESEEVAIVELLNPNRMWRIAPLARKARVFACYLWIVHRIPLLLQRNTRFIEWWRTMIKEARPASTTPPSAP